MKFGFNNAKRQATPQTKYATLGRSSLITIVIFSIINMISLPLTNSYYLFSAYFPFYCSAIGTEFYLNDGSVAMLLLFSAVGLLLLVPYILCYAFAPRHVGWMIGATIIFCIETLFAVGDALLMLSSGSGSMIADCFIHIAVSVMLIIASVCGVRRSRAGLPLTTLTDAELPAPFAPIAEVAPQAEAPAADFSEASEEAPAPSAHSDAVEQERAQRDTRWE